jgi:hypothetical protein
MCAARPLQAPVQVGRLGELGRHWQLSLHKTSLVDVLVACGLLLKTAAAAAAAALQGP